MSFLPVGREIQIRVDALSAKSEIIRGDLRTICNRDTHHYIVAI
jgi:hypothetical protein